MGRQRTRAPPGGVGGNGRSRLPPSFCVLGHCSLALGQRDQYVQTDRGEKGPLERLMGADDKEACLFEDLELLPGRGGAGECP